MDGILNIHKSKGMTSFAVIAALRRLLGVKKAGHAGTLDPDATGVLPVCVGKATKVIEYLMEKDKCYQAVLRLGIETDTQDASGNTLAVRPVEASDESIRAVIQTFVGTQMQTPPMYSAIKVGGRKLYELARQGVEVDREPRLITISAISQVSIARDGDAVRVNMEVYCSKGTYIRTLCADIGARLGCGGHMEALVRTRSGPFTLENAVTLEELAAHKEAGTLDRVTLGMDWALSVFPAFSADEVQKVKLKNGLTLPFAQDSGLMPGFHRIYDPSGSLLAIGRVWSEDGLVVLKSHKWLEL